MIDFLEKTTENFLKKITRIGGDIEGLQTDKPISMPKAQEAELKIRRPLPTDFKHFVTTKASRIYFWWHIDEIDFPEPYAGIFSGGIEFDFNELLQHEESREDWKNACFPDATDEYDKLWHDSIAFHHVPNGDYLAFNKDGKVIYLSHDGSDLHGCVMANSFTDLLKRWTPLGCPGPEDWQWKMFIADSTSGIDPNCIAAKKWLEILQR